MKRALLVGLNYEETENELSGCINDVEYLKDFFSHHENGDKNFDIEVLTDKSNDVTTKGLESKLNKLFKENSDEMSIVLFYFSGHGYANYNGGYLVTNDAKEYAEGIEMDYLLNIVEHSKAKNKVIILDCCHAGKFGEKKIGNTSKLPKGVTILAASKEEEYSYESEEGHGIFTQLLGFALNGEAKNIFGEITASQIYTYIDSSLGSFEQRPVFKTNISKSVILRNVKPSVTKATIKEILRIFENVDSEYQLDPEHEPNLNVDVNLKEYPHISPDTKPNLEKVKIFEILQKLNREGLVKPKNEKHMFYAAIHNDLCYLTPIGKHYWRLCKKERI